jgi:arginase
LSQKFNTNIDYVSNTGNLKNNLFNLYKTNYERMTTNNKININIGGDHSMGIGSVAASLNKYGSNIKVIWIDAHADINTRASSPSGNVHGMPLSFLTGLDKCDDYNFIDNLLPFNNLCYIGIRDLDVEEINVVKKHNIKTILSDNFNKNIDKIINNVINWIGDSQIHISIDVDSLDPKYIQYTGTRVSGGLDLIQLIKFIKNVCSKTNVINLDISELNLYNLDCVNLQQEEKIKSFDNFNLILETICQTINKKF